MMPSEETANLLLLITRGPSYDGHCPFSGFTGSIVPATGPRKKRLLSGPLRKVLSVLSGASDLWRLRRLLRPAETRSLHPHPMQNDAELARQGHLGSLRSTPLGDIHPPAFQRRETRDARQYGVGRFIKRGDAPSRRRRRRRRPSRPSLPDWYFLGVNPNKAPTALDFRIRAGSSIRRLERDRHEWSDARRAHQPTANLVPPHERQHCLM